MQFESTECGHSLEWPAEQAIQRPRADSMPPATPSQFVTRRRPRTLRHFLSARVGQSHQGPPSGHAAPASMSVECCEEAKARRYSVLHRPPTVPAKPQAGSRWRALSGTEQRSNPGLERSDRRTCLSPCTQGRVVRRPPGCEQRRAPSASDGGGRVQRPTRAAPAASAAVKRRRLPACGLARRPSQTVLARAVTPP